MDQDFQQYDNQLDNNSATPKQKVIERLKEANNVLVTVKSDPNVDELASVIGLTLMLNKLEKHTTAVFSGKVPSTLEFLKPDDTIETNTDSLRDFIVSLDKSKADKLRYKVEENIVKIFITPYRTSITEADLEFTQGDFNVDVVIALGVTKREELDNAITAHGRILHDATFITVTAGQDFSELGQINWQEQGASSLSEMLVSISEAFQTGLVDEQIATAFLTGIVAETQRFSNPKTTPKVMTMSAQLMAAGANQQLIANELEKAIAFSTPNEAINEVGAQTTQPKESSDGTLSISHTEDEVKETKPMTIEDIESRHKSEQQNEVKSQSANGDTALLSPFEMQQAVESGGAVGDVSTPMIQAEEDKNSDPNSRLYSQTPYQDKAQDPVRENSSGTLPPLPEMPNLDIPGATLPDANLTVDNLSEADGSIHIDTEGNMMRKAASQPKHKTLQPIDGSEISQMPPIQNGTGSDDFDLSKLGISDSNIQAQPFEPSVGRALDSNSNQENQDDIPIEDNTTLAEIEKAVNSPHIANGTETIDDARSAVMNAFGGSSDMSADPPRSDLNAMPLSAPPETASFDSYRLPDLQSPGNEVNDVSGNLPDESLGLPGEDDQSGGNISPPPVPPPMPPSMTPPTNAL